MFDRIIGIYLLCFIQDSSTKTDAWSQYMAEVKKYKSMSCQDENKTRPLVK